MAADTEVDDEVIEEEFDAVEESQEPADVESNGKAPKSAKTKAPKTPKSAPKKAASPKPAPKPAENRPTAAEKREAAKAAKQQQAQMERNKAALVASMRPVALIMKQIADPTRAAILVLLANGPLNVGQICESLGGMSQPAVSHHLALLRHGRIISPTRDGKNNYYDLEDDGRRLAEVLKSMAKSSG